MSIGIWQLVIILVIVLILFGRGKISQIMGEFGKGINSFKKEIKNQQQDQADKISQDIDKNSLKNLDKKSKKSYK
jgi:sec-independent protein translocase protein TatA